MFQLADAKMENLKEIIGQIVQTICHEVSRRLGERLGRVESKNEDLISKLEKLKEIQINTNSETPRPENFKLDIDQRRYSKSLDEESQKLETRSSHDSPLHKENNLMIGLSNIEVTLQQFDESKETNPMFHLKQLDEYFDLKKIPHTHRLVIACKSVMESMSRHWLEAISDRFQNYEDFKQAFINIWWSTS
jgi:hypothetical protein